VHFFKMEKGLAVSTDIDGLVQTLSINHNPLDWRLFIDSYVESQSSSPSQWQHPYLLFLLVIQCIIMSCMRK